MELSVSVRPLLVAETSLVVVFVAIPRSPILVVAVIVGVVLRVELVASVTSDSTFIEEVGDAGVGVGKVVELSSSRCLFLEETDFFLLSFREILALALALVLPAVFPALGAGLGSTSAIEKRLVKHRAKDPSRTTLAKSIFWCGFILM